MPDHSRYAALRTFVAGWTLLCVVLAAFAAWQTLQLREGADALDGAGRGLERTASSLRELDRLPVVGKQVRDAAGAVADAGETSRTSGAELRTTIVTLAIVVGLGIAILPTAPLIAILWLLGPLLRVQPAERG